MAVVALLSSALLLSSASLQGPAPVPRIEVRVDPRVELMMALARLSGFGEFTQPSAESPYAERVEDYFDPASDHPVFARLKALRETNGVSFDAIASLAVHLGPLPELAELAPFDAAPERLDTRWGGAGARPFLTELRDFVQATEADKFFAGERAFYAEVEHRLGERLRQSKALPWFDGFFGARAASYTAIPGLLAGGGNFGVGIRFADGNQEAITPVFGCWSWDAEGYPVFDAEYLPLFVHELCHSYTNAFVDQFEKELQPIGERLFATCERQMSQQAYGSWKTMMYESFVRASVVRCRSVTEGQGAGEEQAAQELLRGFRWVPAMAKRLGDFEAERTKYPTFADFMPELVKLLEREAELAETTAINAPRLVALVPANGARDVDPSLTSMVITFDREMRDKSWSICGQPENQPKITGSLAYDATRKVLTVPIQLEPGRTYRFSLNAPQFVGFKAKDGTPLQPVDVTFTTRAP